MPSMITALAVAIVAVNAGQVPGPSNAVIIAPSTQLQVFQQPVCHDYEKPHKQCDLSTHYNNTQSKRAKKKKKSKRTAQEAAKIPFTPKKEDGCKKRHTECMEAEPYQNWAQNDQERYQLTPDPTLPAGVNALIISNAYSERMFRCNDDYEECITQS